MPISPQTAFIDRLKQTSQDARADGSLRWNQCDIIDAAVNFLKAQPGAPLSACGSDVPLGEQAKRKSACNAAMIESSPGSGKTRVMGMLAKKAANLDGPNRNGKTAIKALVLTPRLNLNKQTLREYVEELGINPEDVALYDSHQSPAEKARAKDAPILIVTYQSVEKMLKDGALSFDPESSGYRGMVLMDEVHELRDFKYAVPGQPPLTIASFLNDHPRNLERSATQPMVEVRCYGQKLRTAFPRGKRSATPSACRRCSWRANCRPSWAVEIHRQPRVAA